VYLGGDPEDRDTLAALAELRELQHGVVVVDRV
jgi:hypothetical protein